MKQSLYEKNGWEGRLVRSDHRNLQFVASPEEAAVHAYRRAVADVPSSILAISFYMELT